MSEQTPEASPATEPAASTETETQKPTETVEFWKQKAREQETRAKANAKAADELAALKQSQMTEAERTLARLAEMERETQTARAEALRFRIATRHGISDEDAELFLTATDEETLERQAAGLAARNAAAQAAASAQTSPAGPRPDLSQGARDIPLNGDPIEQRLKAVLGIT